MAALHDWQEPLRYSEQQKSTAVATIVVPLDGSGISKAALPVARTLARLYRATLHIAYVGENLAGPRQTLNELGLSSEEMHGAVLDQLSGDPGEAIMASLRKLPDPLLVMCTNTGNSSGHGGLGSVAEAVLTQVPDRVVLVAPERGDAEWRVNRILLAHDSAPSTEVATTEAADIAHRAGAEVIAMHVAAPRAPDLEPGSIPAPRYMDQPQHEWPRWANEFLDRMVAIGATPTKLNFKLLVTGGQPGSEIADFARDNGVDLIVAAWHGQWGEEHAGALPVIVRRAQCPVLVVHVGEAQA